MNKVTKDIVREWDELAFDRLDDLKNNRDISYSKVLKPNMIKLIKTRRSKLALEVGCGVGMLTKEISRYADKIIAIDVSGKSITLAQQYCNRRNIEYLKIGIESFHAPKKYDLIYSNMSLMSIPDLKKALRSIRDLLAKNGRFIFSITHPCFWPEYWHYGDAKFNYLKEKMVITDFKIKNRTYKGLQSRHFHRPLEMYFNQLSKHGFQMVLTKELRNNEDAQRIWYPRFLVVECKLPA